MFFLGLLREQEEANFNKNKADIAKRSEQKINEKEDGSEYEQVKRVGYSEHDFIQLLQVVGFFSTRDEHFEAAVFKALRFEIQFILSVFLGQ